mmetsp:Transcript_4677/g.10711  ORF Transcript_4677/g.10711 Transcript_4677/m.10711 type:complete len:269 (-) Transcript_4677:78-884(-)
MAATKEEKGVSLFTAEDAGTFEAVSAQREEDGHKTARSQDQEGGPARYKEPGLTTPEVRETARALRVARDLRRSSAMAERTNKNREEYKKQLEDEVERKFKSRELRKKEMLLKWSKKLDRSSFLVDQVAESERIDEEQRVKLEEEAKRAKLFEERKQRIKTEIILKALAETNDLEQLRQEKRLIVEEERRLKVAAGQTHKKDCIAEKEEKMKQMQEERRRRNEQHLMQQKNRLAMQQMEEEKRREAILMKMQMKYGGTVPGEPSLTSR